MSSGCRRRREQLQEAGCPALHPPGSLSAHIAPEASGPRPVRGGHLLPPALTGHLERGNSLGGGGSGGSGRKGHQARAGQSGRASQQREQLGKAGKWGVHDVVLETKLGVAGRSGKMGLERRQGREFMGRCRLFWTLFWKTVVSLGQDWGLPDCGRGGAGR